LNSCQWHSFIIDNKNKKMQFITMIRQDELDFAQYELCQIAGALDIVMGIRFAGLCQKDDRAIQLAKMLLSRGLVPKALTYMNTVHAVSRVIVTPFNVQTMLSEKDVTCVVKDQVTTVQGVQFRSQASFLDYKGKEEQVAQLLPGTEVVPFDVVFAVNIAVTASVTKYVVEDNAGIVISVSNDDEMYPNAPSRGTQLVKMFPLNLAGMRSRQGMDWANFLYHRYYHERAQFSQDFALWMQIPSNMMGMDRRWSKLFSPQYWPALSATSPEQAILMMQRARDFQDETTRGKSVMSCAVYGQELGETYQLAKKIQNLRYFLESVPQEMRTKQLCIVTADEQEKSQYQNLCHQLFFESIKIWEVRFVQPGMWETSEPLNCSDQVVYDPRSLTMQYLGAPTEEGVREYVTWNAQRVEDRIKCFRGALYVGVRAHVLGLEKYVVGMACPHKAIGVIVFGCIGIQQTVQQVWGLVSLAIHARGTFLYTRRTLKYYMDLIVKANVRRRVEGEVEINYSPYVELERPPIDLFSNYQRKRDEFYLLQMGVTLNQGLLMTDIEVSNLVNKYLVIEQIRLRTMGSDHAFSSINTTRDLLFLKNITTDFDAKRYRRREKEILHLQIKLRCPVLNDAGDVDMVVDNRGLPPYVPERPPGSD